MAQANMVYIGGTSTSYTFNLTLPTTWTLDEETNLYYQDVEKEGSTEDDILFMEPVLTDKTLTEIETIEEEVAKIKYFDTMEDKIRFYASEETTSSVELLAKGV